MVKGAVLQGYLLEEALAWLLRSSGYRLLVHASQDPDELVTDGNTLRVRGRGALHQVDALGEFAFTPAFSMPVRLFLEAKFKQDRCGLEIVRNAHGVLHDVNENFMTHAGRRPRQRYHYAYALFSTSGFTPDAQKYAVAHQISLVDMSGASFAWLLGTIGTTAWTLEQAQGGLGKSATFPVTWLRTELRKRLGTWTASPSLLSSAVPTDDRFRKEAAAVIADFADALRRNGGAELLLGFPSAPFILPLAVNNHLAFTSYADAQPDHAVRIRRRGSGGSAEWTLSPLGQEGAYELAFKLPEQVEEWISDVEEKERRRTVEVKEQFLSTITIYRMNGGGVRAYQLRYEPSSLSRS
ncbi:restriction endonuclease [Kitasatospora acidiphila]|uniref:Restriction endonuclease n=1 Tax=Kitasatospora acidiphila TaxID=2567942 RepID=A0A540WDX8_9ACTN|nr:restriction endonuclease [Kitasatospora acidiphila]TQF07168.1 restriction endonuclease [Kitasatospora acidiphila]